LDKTIKSVFPPSIVLFVLFQSAFAQTTLENWQTYADPEKRFTLFYPPSWLAEGKKNFLSSVDLTLTEPRSDPLRVFITYRVNDSMLNSSQITPEVALGKYEDEQKPAYRLYSVIRKSPRAYSVYGFPAASDLVDYTKHGGQFGRSLNVLAIVNGKNTFSLTYSNSIQSFYQSLPLVEEIITSILILR
jgi:hypothetical protein